MAPALIESSPKSGPTVLSSTIFKGAGSEPDLKRRAKSVADWNVKFPVITPFPPSMGSLIFGALIISLSNIIASFLPTLFVVTLPNFFVPTLSREKLTVGWPVWLSTTDLALSRLCPLITTLLLISNVFSLSTKGIGSEPNSFSLSETNLKVKFAVFPKSFLILFGSDKPGNSTNILSFPLLIIVGSLVPTSSILLLTISKDCSKVVFFNSIKPNLVNLIFTKLFSISYSIS